jgi:TPP-dependent pyruvate/acetoin dehydrogenase alpha subunit
MTEDEATAIETEAKTEVDEAYKFARESNYPEPEEALEDVFV